MKVEIIVIDDGSTDGTAEWLREQDDVLIVQGDGWGKPWGVNKAFSLVRGKYLRYLDSDDWLNPNANEEQFEIAERDDADVVVSGTDIYTEDTLMERSPWIETDDFIAQQLGETQGSHYSAFLFRREFIKDIPHRTLFPASNFASRDDRCFILEVALRHPRISASPNPALCHRHHDKPRLQFRRGLGEIGSNMQSLHIYRQILHLLDVKGELTLRRKRAAIKVLWPLAHGIADSHQDEACEVADWVYQLDPEFKPPESGLLGWLYSAAGFKYTERLLFLRRSVLSVFR